MGNRVLLSTAILTGLLFCYSEWRRTVPTGPPNILLITIDTLRRDRFGCYGSPSPSTPNLDALASKGVVFENYYSTANCTIPSHLSMFSSKLPSTIQILDNEKYDVAARTTTLPSLLKGLGYKTHGVASAFFFRKNWLAGFGSLFDTFTAPPIPKNEFKAEEVKAEFQKLLPELKKERFFCWLHFYDPHSPYNPPIEYKNAYDSSGSRGMPVPHLSETIETSWMVSMGLSHTWQARVRYRGEVAYTDAQIGKIMELMKQNGLDRNTVVFVVADHGELLGDHHLYYTHEGLYEGTIHVPFIAYGEGFKRRRVSEFVSGLDIAPSIIELAGGKMPADFQGLSVIPFLRGDHPKRTRKIYSVSAYAFSIAVLQYPYKLIFNKPQAGRPEPFELYEFNIDRFERRNRIKKELPVASELLHDSIPSLFASSKNEFPQFQMTAEDKQKLKALGYAQ